MKLESAFAEFVLAAEADGLRVRTTVRWYKAMLVHLVDYYSDVDLEAISATMMRKYIVMLRGRNSRFTTGRSSRPMIKGGLSQSTLRGHNSALSRFWNWCNQEYKLAHNPMENIRKPPRPQAQPKGISLEAVIALMEATNDDIFGARDRAMLAFMIDTGCRSQGLLQLELSSLELEERRAFVIEKERPQRTLFLSEFTLDLLKAWIEVRPASATTLFCSLSPVYYGQPLSYEGLVGILKKLKEKAGIQGPVNPHSFRHAFGREYIKNGGDLATCSVLMGHSSSLVTSMYYTIFAKTEYATSHDKFSPVNRIKEYFNQRSQA